MLTKPRTVWACQPVAAMISANVAPLARFIKATTSAFLLVGSAFGLPADFLADLGFFVPLAFLAGLFPLLGVTPASSVPAAVSESIALLMRFS